MQLTESQSKAVFPHTERAADVYMEKTQTETGGRSRRPCLLIKDLHALEQLRDTRSHLPGREAPQDFPDTPWRGQHPGKGGKRVQHPAQRGSICPKTLVTCK